MLWHGRDDAGAIKRAIKAREYVVSEERGGRNVLVRAAEIFSAEPWREEWWKTAESVTDTLAYAESVRARVRGVRSGPLMWTIVTWTRRKSFARVWKVVRTHFAAKDPAQMQKVLGVVREAWAGASSCRGLRLTQSDYTAKILEDAVKLGFGPIRVCTTVGQSVTPPDSGRTVRSWSARACRKFVVPVTLHTFRSFLRYRTARKICHTLVRVGSKGNETHSRFCRTLS